MPGSKTIWSSRRDPWGRSRPAEGAKTEERAAHRLSPPQTASAATGKRRSPRRVEGIDEPVREVDPSAVSDAGTRPLHAAARTTMAETRITKRRDAAQHGGEIACPWPAVRSGGARRSRRPWRPRSRSDPAPTRPRWPRGRHTPRRAPPSRLGVRPSNCSSSARCWAGLLNFFRGPGLE